VSELTRREALKGAACSGAILALPFPANATEPIMKRPIPKSGEALPAVGLGTWQTFDIGNSAEERAGREEVLRLLLESQGSVIDSSPMYGRAEGVVGEMIELLDAREKSFLATKVWTRGRDDGIAQMAESLRRFRTDYVDLMQIHNLLDWQTHLPTLRTKKAAGEFRYIGVTHYTRHALDDLIAVMETEEIDFVQMAYSIGERAVEDRLLPLAAERGIAVIVNRPYEGGGLFRSIRGEQLPVWASEFDCESWGQFFLKFILGHPAVTCVIPGTSKPRHMLDNLGAGRGRLPDAATRRRMIQFWEDV